MGCTASTPAQKQAPLQAPTSKDNLPVDSRPELSESVKTDSDVKASSTSSKPAENLREEKQIKAEDGASKSPAVAQAAKAKGVAFDVPSQNQERPGAALESQPPTKKAPAQEHDKDAIIPKLLASDSGLLNVNRKLEDYYDVDRSKRIGKGHYASVFVARNKATGEKVAVKMVEKRLSKAERLALEVSVMRKAGAHPHIVQLIDVFETETQLQIVLELVEGGELFEHLVEHGPYSEATAALHIRDVTRAIAFLHSQNIIHRDLKPENILLTSKDDSARIKVADFGLAKLMFADVTRTVCGTWAYCAYEVKKPGGAYDNKCDVWSIGVIAYILVSAYHPFDPQGDATDDEIWVKISKADYNFDDPAWNNVSDQAKDFISKLLVLDPKRRMSAEEALQHPWLKNVPEDVAETETQPALSPQINDKLATFQSRSRTAQNPLQKAAAAMRQRVGSWKSASTSGSSSPSWGPRNLVIAAAAAAAAARSATRAANSGGGERAANSGGGEETGSPSSRKWSMGGSGRFTPTNAGVNGRSSSQASPPSSSAIAAAANSSEEKSDTPPQVFFGNNQPHVPSPLRNNGFVSQTTGDTMLVPPTPKELVDDMTEFKDQSNENELTEQPSIPELKEAIEEVDTDEEDVPNSPTTGAVIPLRITATGEEGDDTTLRSSDLDTVSDLEEDMVDANMHQEHEKEISLVSDKSESHDVGASFKTAREVQDEPPIVENV